MQQLRQIGGAYPASANQLLEKQSLRLKRSYIVATLLLGVVLFASFWMLDNNIQSQRTHAQLISLSSSQQLVYRQLFERSTHLKSAIDDESASQRYIEQIRARLWEDVATLEVNQSNMYQLLGSLGDTESSRILRGIYFEAPHRLAQRQKSYSRRLKTVLESSIRELRALPGAWVPLDTASASQGLLSHGYREALQAVVRNLERETHELSMMHRLLTGVIVFVLLLEALLIYRPLANGLRRVNRQVVDAQKSLDQLAFYDEVTQLPNRNELVRKYTTLSEEDPARNVSLILLRIQNLTNLQTAIGVENADQFIFDLSTRLEGLLPAQCDVARTGYEEFCLLHTGQFSQEFLTRIERLVEAVSHVLYVRDIPAFPKVAASIVHLPEHSTTIERALMNARLTIAHQSGEMTLVSIYNPKTGVALEREEQLATELRRAIANNEFVPWYQVKLNTATGSIEGVEALIRWQHPVRGLLLPEQFLPLAEKTGLIVPMTWGLLPQITTDMNTWKSSDLDPIRVAINLSEAVLLDTGFTAQIDHLLSNIGDYDPSRPPIEFEITENVALSEFKERIDRALRYARSRGIEIALDDFGTGYASLTHLTNLDYDMIKIDQRFIRDMVSDVNSRSIVESVVAMCAKMNKTCIAEGIENREQSVVLDALGCDIQQGFLFAKPAAAQDIPKIINRPRAVSLAGKNPEPRTI